MKKYLSLLMLAVFMAVFASACEDETEGVKPETDHSNTTDEEVIGYYHPVPVFENLERQNEGVPDDLGVEPETDYSNITVYSDYEVYPKDTEEIKYYVKNNNPGKGFWLNERNHVELLDDEGCWVQLRFKYEGVDETLSFCFGLDHEPPYVIAERRFYFSHLAEPLKAGEYRLLIFVGEETLYLPFTVE